MSSRPTQPCKNCGEPTRFDENALGERADKGWCHRCMRQFLGKGDGQECAEYNFAERCDFAYKHHGRRKKSTHMDSYDMITSGRLLADSWER